MKIHLDFLVERLKLYDQTLLIELLDITSEEIINRFIDVVQDKRDFLQEELEIFVATDDDEQDIDYPDLHMESFDEDN